jgi:hypothetical protein
VVYLCGFQIYITTEKEFCQAVARKKTNILPAFPDS